MCTLHILQRSDADVNKILHHAIYANKNEREQSVDDAKSLTVKK